MNAAPGRTRIRWVGAGAAGVLATYVAQSILGAAVTLLSGRMFCTSNDLFGACGPEPVWFRRTLTGVTVVSLVVGALAFWAVARRWRKGRTASADESQRANPDETP